MPKADKSIETLDNERKAVNKLHKAYEKLNKEINEFINNMEKVEPYLENEDEDPSEEGEEYRDKRFGVGYTDFCDDDADNIYGINDEEESGIDPLPLFPMKIGKDTYIRKGPIYLPWGSYSIDDLFK